MEKHMEVLSLMNGDIMLRMGGFNKNSCVHLSKKKIKLQPATTSKCMLGGLLLTDEENTTY